eukprot:scaffold938_cov334-Pavlova_lutheri.AAC.3
MHVGPTVEGSPFHHQAVRRACATAMAEAAHLVAQYLKEEGCMQALEAFRKERKLARGDAVRPRRGKTGATWRDYERATDLSRTKGSAHEATSRRLGRVRGAQRTGATREKEKEGKKKGKREC